MSNNLQRKINRKNHLKDKRQAEKNLEKSIKNMSLPDFCKNCAAPFDRKSREQAQTWRVISKNEGEDKYLLCDTCWDKIQGIISSE